MESKLVFIETEPDKRYHPVCHNCGSVAKKIHSYNRRMVRDLNVRMNAYASLRLRLSSDVPTGPMDPAERSDAIGVGWWWRIWVW
jgi:hypothetical protein